MVSVYFAQVLRSWLCASLAFGCAEPPRRPWKVLAGNKASGLLEPWNRMAYVSSRGFISGVVKGQQEKSAAPRNGEATDESSISAQYSLGRAV